MDASDRPYSDAAGSASPEPSGDGARQYQRHPTPGEAVAQLTALAKEYREYVSYFLSAKADQARFSLRQAAMYAVAGIVAFIAAATTIVMAVVLFLLGAAIGLGTAFGDGLQWLGALIIGLLVLALVGLVVYAGMRWMANSYRKKTVKKYEQRQNWQRRQFGHDVTERAAEQRAERI